MPQIDTLCVCGRMIRQGTKHCVICGSTNTYDRSRSGRTEAFIDPATNKRVLVQIPGYHCRKCGANFAADTPCVAQEPPVKALTRVEDQQARRQANKPERVPPDQLYSSEFQYNTTVNVIKANFLHKSPEEVSFLLAEAKLKRGMSLTVEEQALIDARDNSTSNGADTYTNTTASIPLAGTAAVKANGGEWEDKTFGDLPDDPEEVKP